MPRATFVGEHQSGDIWNLILRGKEGGLLRGLLNHTDQEEGTPEEEKNFLWKTEVEVVALCRESTAFLERNLPRRDFVLIRGALVFIKNVIMFFLLGLSFWGVDTDPKEPGFSDLDRSWMKEWTNRIEFDADITPDS